MRRRFNRPWVRRLRARDGRTCYAFAVGPCACGWSELVGGTYGMALRVANAHWATHTPAPWRPGSPSPFELRGGGETPHGHAIP